MVGVLINSTYLLIAGGIGIVLLAMVYFLGNFFLTVKKQAPAIMVFRKAYKEHKPVVEIIDGSGIISYFLGDKDKRYDVEYKNKDYSIKIDSNYSSVTPEEHFTNGVRVLRYGIGLHFPIDSRGIHSLIQLVQYIRTSFPILDVFSDDMVLIEFVDIDSEDLPAYIRSKLKDFDPHFDDDDENRIKDLVKVIESIKEDLPALEIRSRPFSIAGGLQLVPTAFAAQDCEKVVQLTEFKTKKEGMWDTKVWTYATIMIVSICALGAVVYVLTM